MLANGKVGKKAKLEAAKEIKQGAATAKATAKKRKREEKAAAIEAKVRQAHRQGACPSCMSTALGCFAGWRVGTNTGAASFGT